MSPLSTFMTFPALNQFIPLTWPKPHSHFSFSTSIVSQQSIWTSVKCLFDFCLRRCSKLILLKLSYNYRTLMFNILHQLPILGFSTQPSQYCSKLIPTIFSQTHHMLPKPKYLFILPILYAHFLFYSFANSTNPCCSAFFFLNEIMILLQ